MASRFLPPSLPDTCTIADLEALAEAIVRGEHAPFGTILLDPPWRYRDQGRRGAAAKHYACMSVAEIAALPVGQLAAARSHLHLWTTSSFLGEAIALCRHWGFAYKSSFVWTKPQLGMGSYWRVSHEVLVLGVRGRLCFADRGLRSWIEAPRARHSAKPAVVRSLIERASPKPRLELFARDRSPCWVAWGNEIDRAAFIASTGNATKRVA